VRSTGRWSHVFRTPVGLAAVVGVASIVALAVFAPVLWSDDAAKFDLTALSQGAGRQPPDYDWGRMLSEGLARIFVTPMVALGPAGAIVLAALAFTLLGETLAKVAAGHPTSRWKRERADAPPAEPATLPAEDAPPRRCSTSTA